MTPATLQGLRDMARVVTEDGRYKLSDRKGRVCMSGLTRERADHARRYLPGGRIERM